MVISDPIVLRHILKENVFSYDKGVLSEILEPFMGQVCVCVCVGGWVGGPGVYEWVGGPDEKKNTHMHTRTQAHTHTHKWACSRRPWSPSWARCTFSVVLSL
jgi:hypothetical protein